MMSSNKIAEGSARHLPGESAPLIPRDKSSFVLNDDTHVLGRKASPENAKQIKKNKQKTHHHLSSDTTLLSWNALKPSSRGSNRRLPKLRASSFLVIGCYLLAVFYTLIVLIGPLVLSFQKESDWCPVYDDRNLLSGDFSSSAKEHSAAAGFSWDMTTEEKEYNNPDFIKDPCRYVRVPHLVWLTLEECDYSRRMLTSVILGSAIGLERRSSDRPAGIRTMGLVSLGACFFTVSSIVAFRSSTMGWDASRVTAALPSGVGFLGAALIWKGSMGEGDEETHQVHGLTTAASLWLSAAIGVGAGGALYVVSVYSTVLIIFVLRYGPKFYLQADYEEEGEDNDNEEGKEADDDTVADYLRQYADVERRSMHEEVSQPEEGPSRRISFEPSFPQSLTTEDRIPMRALSRGSVRESVRSFVEPSFPQSLTTEDRMSMRTLSRGSVRESVRSRRQAPHLEPPTFHS